jgi:hypothetical protein
MKEEEIITSTQRVREKRRRRREEGEREKMAKVRLKMPNAEELNGK